MSFGFGIRRIEDGPIDRGILLGALISFALIGAGIIFSGQWLTFLNPAGLLIVLGGTYGATLIHFSAADMRAAWASLRRVLTPSDIEPIDRISYLVELAQRVRQNGILVLEDEAAQTDDPFLRLSLEVAVDSAQHPDLRRILETEIRTSHDRASRAVHVFETMGNYTPAMGLIGTLIGLIRMLSALHDPASVGPAMAIALVTTFYGAFFANVIFLPLAGKIRNRNEEEALIKSITVEGVLSLEKQESAVVLEQRLQSFMPLAAAA